MSGDAGKKPGNLKLSFKEPTQVKYTGDWSLDSKTSSILNGYWKDPFMSFFNHTKVDSVPRRTSLICRGYYVRFRVCDFFLRNILDSSIEPIQIVSFGCGMDTSFFRLLPQFEEKISKFFELDFDSVIKTKKEIIESNELLQIMSRDKLILLPADLRNTGSLNEILKNGGFDFDVPTLFYSECVVNYLQPSESEAILKWIVDNIPKSIWLAYEQCFANDSFGTIMTRHFTKNGCPILSLPSHPDMVSQTKQLEQVGFEEFQVHNAWDAFLYLTRNETFPFPKISSDNRHQFDEYEALLATCLHYTVRVGRHGNICKSISQFLDSTTAAIVDLKEPYFKQSFATIQLDSNSDSTIEIYTCEKKLSGHAAVSFNPNEIFIMGGIESSSHRSLSLIKIDINNTDCDSSKVPDEGNPQNLSSCAEKLSEIDIKVQNGFKSLTRVEKVKEDRRFFERVNSSVAFHERSNSYYIFGGRKSPQDPCTNELIQVHSQSVHIIKTLSFNNVDAPVPRWRHSMILISKTNSLMVLGGKNETGILGDCWNFYFSEGRWKESKWNRMPCARHSHSMACDSKGHIYCIGGILEDETTLCLDAVWKFEISSAEDIGQGEWTNLPDLSVYGRRIGHSCVISEDILFIVGGYGANSAYNLNHFVTLINLNTKVVRSLDLEFSPDNLFIPFGFSTTLVAREESNAIVVFGGGGNCFSFGSHFNNLTFVIPIESLLKYM